MQWLLEIRTDRDAALQVGDEPTVSDLVCAFRGNAEEIRLNCIQFVSSVQVDASRSRPHVLNEIKAFLARVPDFLDKKDWVNDELLGDYGNLSMRFCEDNNSGIFVL